MQSDDVAECALAVFEHQKLKMFGGFQFSVRPSSWRSGTEQPQAPHRFNNEGGNRDFAMPAAFFAQLVCFFFF